MWLKEEQQREINGLVGSVPLVWKTTPRYGNLETNSIGLLLHVITSDLAKCPPLLNFIILVLPMLMPI